MRYGRTVEDGFLPVFSVRTEKEAKTLLVAACELSIDGNEYLARELGQEQTLENLSAFSDRLKEMAERIGLLKGRNPRVKRNPKRKGK